MDPMILSILLLLLGITFVILELFIPSGGVLGFLAALLIIAALIVGFTAGIKTGTIILAATVVLLPVAIAMAIRVWPKTPMGRSILIKPATGDDVLPDGEEYTVLKEMIGRRGTAKTDMLPSGIVIIDRREFDAVSVGMPIDARQAVRVVNLETNHLIVRPVGEDEAPEIEKTEDDLLARPLDSLGLDPFEDPLA